MVDKRVEQNLHTSQMEDDSLNVEFLEWLKKWGPNIIIAVALAVIIFQGSQWWMKRAEDKRSLAWADLANTENVASLLKVADDNQGVGSVAELAWLKAAQLHYQTIINDQPLESDALSSTTEIDPETNEEIKNQEDKPTSLRSEDRADLLDKMQTMYQNVIDRTKDHPEKLMLQIRATFGMATVAEMKLDSDSAKSWYDKAIALTDPYYPKLTALAKARMQDLKEQNVPLEIPTAAEVNKIKEATTTPSLLKRPVPVPKPSDATQSTETPSNDKQESTSDSPNEDQPKNNTDKNPPADDAPQDDQSDKNDDGPGQ